ncbi:diadenylate cyclase [Trichlorobacter lovleyi]|uniref:diadenylate cyclase n=1 Tax=Trichlorobacter lovleyi TaxID=313985 RepID=UPI0023EFA55D|nr:diadenylate cyclase [Trichlorobacter lovleyi]
MPLNVFDAIRPTISTLLGGASVDLRAGEDETKTGEGRLLQPVAIEGKSYSFSAVRQGLPFTKTEIQFCRELLTAFSGLYSGFKLEGYAAHFRTALLASIMDITVARFLRGDRSKGFWPIQQLIQLLKNLSYQRYEGKPATTGFLVHRTTEPALRKTIKDRSHTLIPLQPHQSVTPTFLDNPLAYRFIDGNNLFFVATIQMQVVGVLRTAGVCGQTDIERLTQRELFSLVRRSGSGAFAITVNEVSEIEVLISPAKLLIRRKGAWVIFDPDIFRSFLADSIDNEAVDDLLWTLYAVSKQRHGTVILIHAGTARHLATLKKGSVGGDDPIGRLLISQVKGQTIAQLKQSGILLRILSSDGMTVLDNKGKLLETGFIIDTSHAREMVTGGGRTTAAIAASFFGKVIKVSQDGPIELYQDGKLIYRFG